LGNAPILDRLTPRGLIPQPCRSSYSQHSGTDHGFKTSAIIYVKGSKLQSSACRMTPT
jgi:hypothetical protein